MSRYFSYPALFSALLLPLGVQAAPQEPFQQAEQLDALQQQRQQQQEAERAAQLETGKDIHFEKLKAESLSLPDESASQCFKIAEISVVDYSADGLVDKSQFQWAFNQAVKNLNLTLPHCFGGAGLNVLLRATQNAIVERGFVTTRVVLGEQDLNSGKLVLTVIPGRVRHTFIEDKSGVDKFTRLTALTALTFSENDLLNVRDIEQSLENFKRVPTADANINILPTEDSDAPIGYSDLSIQYAQAFPFRLTLGLDDAGLTSTGRLQGSMTLSWDNIFTANDLFYTNFTHAMARPDWLGNDERGARRSKNLTFYYSVPFGYWNLSASHTVNKYHQEVAAAYGSTVMYAGESETTKATLSRVIFRNNAHKTTLSGGLWLRQSKNYIDDEELDIQRKRTGGWEVGVVHRAFLGSGTLELDAHFKRGTGLNHSLRYPDEKFNESSSRMKILTASLSYTQPFDLWQQRFVFNTSWNAQWNKTPLAYQDRFSIGGRYTVRGTDGELTLSGERGWFWRNELAWNIPNIAQQLYITLDKGTIHTRQQEDQVGRSLVGTSLGFRGGWKWFNYDVFVGKALHVPEGFRTKNKVVGFNFGASF